MISKMAQICVLGFFLLKPMFVDCDKLVGKLPLWRQPLFLLVCLVFVVTNLHPNKPLSTLPFLNFLIFLAMLYKLELKIVQI
jgi:hypothetical protein